MTESKLPRLEKLRATYVQESDYMETSENDLQVIEFSTEDAGGGPYFFIKTDRWAFDNPDELLRLVSDFEQRFELKPYDIV